MIVKCIKLLIILWAVMQPQYFFAQTLHFQNYNSSNGLSQNSVYSIAQTNEGLMWFGTQDGLNRFDGKTFTKTVPVLVDKNATKSITTFSKQITALCADDDWLWCGTTYELVAYNRKKNMFILPNKVYENFINIHGTWITKVDKDNEGNIWILTRNQGLLCYNKKKGAMQTIQWTIKKPLDIISFSINNKGYVLAVTAKEIFICTNKSNFTIIPVNKYTNLKDQEWIDASFVNNEAWLVAANSQIWMLQNPTETTPLFTFFNSSYKGNTFLNAPRQIHQSDSNTVWIGSRTQGVIKVNLSNKTFENAISLDNSNSLERSIVLSFCSGVYGITWIGLSGAGVSKYDGARVQLGLWRVPANIKGLVPDNMIMSIHASDENNIYVGTMTGGLFYLNKQQNIWQNFLPPNLLRNGASKNIYAIVQDANLLWLATWGGIFSFNLITKGFQGFTDANDKETRDLTSLIKLQNTNYLLTGGYNGGLRLFDVKTKKFSPIKDVNNILATHQFRVRYMLEIGNNGDVYMGSEAYSFLKYNYRTGVFTFYPNIQSLAGDCRHFCFTNNQLWLATTDGLLQVNPANMQVIKTYTSANGLPNSYVYAVQADAQNNIWASTNEGIVNINTTTGLCHKFIMEDGLNALEFNTASTAKTKAGTLWFGGINGINTAQQVSVSSITYSPKPLITGIRVMNIPYTDSVEPAYINQITLPYTKNFISFEFQTPLFSQTENIQYQYMLSGVDTGWVSNGNEHFANYTQLKPGHYTFKVRSANAANEYGTEEATIQLIIVPPWYNTWWFIGLIIIASSLLIFYFLRQRIAAIKSKGATKQHIAETEMAALKAQMNPHFMFNCINSIDAFIQSNDKYNATLYLNKFAKLIRNILDSSKQNVVPLTKDIETLKLYLELESLRNEGKFTTNLQIPQTLLQQDFYVPPLIIQPFVENAILHGLKNKDDNSGQLIITLDKQENKLTYTIQDNGIGRSAAAAIPQTKEASYGMQLSSDRVKLFNKEKNASITIEDLYSNEKAIGTKVIVQLNIV